MERATKLERMNTALSARAVSQVDRQGAAALARPDLVMERASVFGVARLQIGHTP